MRLLVFALLHLLKPTRRPHTDRHMRHHRVLARTMPMHLPSRNVNHISDPQDLGLLAPRTHEACPHRYLQDLAMLMTVPEGASAGREAHVVGHAVEIGGFVVGFGFEDRVHVHCAGECLCWLAGGSVGRVRALDEQHGGVWWSLMLERFSVIS